MDNLDKFRDLLNTSTRVVVLTGAGVSAESGIPTYRDNNGLWRKYNPLHLGTTQAFAKDPSLIWEFYHWMRQVIAQSQPNPAHYALAALQKRLKDAGRHFTLITQNVDQLHQAAGSTDVIDMHGSIWHVCPATRTGGPDRRSGRPYEDRRQPLVPALAGAGAPNVATPANIPVDNLPRDENGKLLRPAVVWFEEDIDNATLDKIEAAIDACDLLISIGTSSKVFPAASYAPKVAKRGGAVVEFNAERTAITDVCRMSFQGKAGELLPVAFQVEAEVKQMMAARQS